MPTGWQPSLPMTRGPDAARGANLRPVRRPLAVVVLAWSAGTLALALGGFSLAFHLLDPASASNALPLWAGNAAQAAAFGLVGALIAARRPRHPIGWLLVGGAVLAGLGALAGRYGPAAYWAAARAASLGLWATWLASWVRVPAGVLGMLAVLLFPDGRLPSPRWRRLLWAGGAAAALDVVGAAFGPGPLYGTSIPNPVGLAWARPLVAAPGLSWAPELAVLAGVALSLVARFRRAAGLERQQLKWAAYAVGLAGPVFVTAALVDYARGEQLFLPLAGPAAVLLGSGGIAAAVLRYRLYGIDLVIRRTLVYGLLTAGLGLAYWASVLVLQQLLRPLTQGSELAVIGSTLTVAALFRPARAAVQRAVDRRFYRRKYDAQRTLGAFGDRLRREVDLDAMSAELLRVVRETVQPAHASLWLRPGAGRGGASSGWGGSL